MVISCSPLSPHCSHQSALPFKSRSANLSHPPDCLLPNLLRATLQCYILGPKPVYDPVFGPRSLPLTHLWYHKCSWLLMLWFWLLDFGIGLGLFVLNLFSVCRICLCLLAKHSVLGLQTCLLELDLDSELDLLSVSTYLWYLLVSTIHIYLYQSLQLILLSVRISLYSIYPIPLIWQYWPAAASVLVCTFLFPYSCKQKTLTFTFWSELVLNYESQTHSHHSNGIQTLLVQYILYALLVVMYSNYITFLIVKTECWILKLAIDSFSI